MIDDNPGPHFPNKPARKFVVVPLDPRDRTKAPLRMPKHYCIDCDMRYVVCGPCQTTSGPASTFGMMSNRDGYHVGMCPIHGAISNVCPQRYLTHTQDTGFISNPKADDVHAAHGGSPNVLASKETLDAFSRDIHRGKFDVVIDGLTATTSATSNAFKKTAEEAVKAEIGLDKLSDKLSKPLDPLEHERKLVRAAATVSLAIGFIAGVILTAAALFLLRL